MNVIWCVCVCAVNHPILNFFSSGENWKKNFTHGSCFFLLLMVTIISNKLAKFEPFGSIFLFFGFRLWADVWMMMVLTWKAWSKGRRATSQRFSFFYCCCCCMNDNTIFNWISFFLSFNQHVLIQQTCCLQWSAKPGWSDFSVSRPQCVFMLLLVGWTALSDFLWFLVWFDSTAKFITMVTHDDLFLWKNKKTSFFQFIYSHSIE